jgi:hypothetical protein
MPGFRIVITKYITAHHSVSHLWWNWPSKLTMKVCIRNIHYYLDSTETMELQNTISNSISLHNFCTVFLWKLLYFYEAVSGHRMFYVLLSFQGQSLKSSLVKSNCGLEKFSEVLVERYTELVAEHDFLESVSEKIQRWREWKFLQVTVHSVLHLPWYSVMSHMNKGHTPEVARNVIQFSKLIISKQAPSVLTVKAWLTY